MSTSAVHRSPSPSPIPSPTVPPFLSLHPGTYPNGQLSPTPYGPAGYTGDSLSPSAESLQSSSLLQIPPPPPSRPRSASSLVSLPPNSSRPRQSSVSIPPVPPPPRPRSSPSLSTLLTVQPASSSPLLLSSSANTTHLTKASSPRRQRQQQQELQEQQEILRKYSDLNRYAVASTVTLRVDAGDVKLKTSDVVTSLVDLSKHFRSLDSAEDGEAGENAPRDAARVKFLPKEGKAGRDGVLTVPLSGREKCLGILSVVLFLACLLFLVVAFTKAPQLTVFPSQSRCLSSTCVSTAAQLMAAMDMTADPCEDFFQYACGGWNKRHVIPEDKHSYNTFEKLHDELQLVLRQLLEEDRKDHDSAATLKAKTLYKSCVNTTQINDAGDTPLRQITEKLGGWPIILDQWDRESFHLEAVLGNIHHDYNAAILIGCWIAADDKNSTTNIIQLDQPGLGMPDREYYLKVKSESEFVRAYLNFMRGVVQLMGAPEATLDNELIDLLEFETKLANVTRPRAERQDTEALYKKMSISQLQQLIPQMNWLKYLRHAISPTLTPEEEVVIFAVDYLRDMINIVLHTDKRTVANYVIWRVVMLLSPELTDSYQEVHNQYKMVLHGVKRAKIRWKKCVEYVNEQMGLAIGAMFVRDNFRRKSKETALEMIRNIRNAFNELLTENQWMDEQTKTVARQKANAMDARIGYPDFITVPPQLDKKYEGLLVDESHYFNNILAVKRFAAEKKLSRLGQPVEKDVWEQAPAEINAFYNPNSNDIVFPAGILQPLFYSEHFPKSLNYGGIGVVIGHEITHGFDDKGRQYDIDGNLKQWWDNATIAAFRQRAQCMVEQYSGFRLEQTGHYINGKQTQGENIADNGGLKQAYRAYRKWVETHGEERQLPGIGLSHDQLFFLNYAQIWCGKVRDEEALHTIRTSVHSPGPTRVLGPLSNSMDFAKAYSCPRGSRMNPYHKCSVW